VRRSSVTRDRQRTRGAGSRMRRRNDGAAGGEPRRERARRRGRNARVRSLGITNCTFQKATRRIYASLTISRRFVRRGERVGWVRARRGPVDLPESRRAGSVRAVLHAGHALLRDPRPDSAVRADQQAARGSCTEKRRPREVKALYAPDPQLSSPPSTRVRPCAVFLACLGTSNCHVTPLLNAIFRRESSLP
jgi:hypothetical protein